MLLEGLHIPLTTPFAADGSVALPKLAANVARYSKTPAAGLIVLSPSAEPTLLSDDEAREVLSTAAEAAAPEKVLLAGITRDSVRSVLALADFSAEHHYDAILIQGPALDPSFVSEDLTDKSEDAMRSILVDRVQKRAHLRLPFFRAVADRSPLPVVVLSRPGRPVASSDAAELATHPNIIGVIDMLGGGTQAQMLLKGTEHVRREVTVTQTFAAVTARMKLAAEATPSPALISAGSLTRSVATTAEQPPTPPQLRTRTKSIGFQVLSGNSSSLLAALNAGATGIAPAFAACTPQACYEVYAAWKDAALSGDKSDQPLAEEKQTRIREAAYLAESLGPGGLKYACDLTGYAGGLPRLPHLPPTGSQGAALEALMQGLRN